MDTREDLAWYAMERTSGPIPKEPNEWDIIEDNHYPECPTAAKARQKLPSTLCLCKEIEKAEKMSDAEIEKWDRKEEKGA